MKRFSTETPWDRRKRTQSEPDLAAYDCCPASVREALAHSALNLSAEQAYCDVQRRGERYTVQAIKHEQPKRLSFAERVR